MRVLVVEDHKRLAEAVAGGLRDEGMAVDVAHDGQDALDHVALTRYDVIVLDRDLPGVHGDLVCQDLALRRCPSRVLMLTAAPPSPTGSRAWAWARMTTCPSRSTSPNSWPGSGPWPAAPPSPSRRSSPAVTCRWTRLSGSPPGRAPAGAGPQGVRGARMPARRRRDPVTAEELLERVWDENADFSPPPSRPPSAGCAPNWATRRSSAPSATAATGSARHHDRPGRPAGPRRPGAGCRARPRGCA